MSGVAFLDGAIEVDAAIVAEGLGMTPAVLQQRIREGRVTSLCERGIDEDAGRYRLTFFSPSTRLRLVVDAGGNVIRRSMIDFSGPRAARQGPA